MKRQIALKRDEFPKRFNYNIITAAIGYFKGMLIR